MSHGSSVLGALSEMVATLFRKSRHRGVAARVPLFVGIALAVWLGSSGAPECFAQGRPRPMFSPETLALGEKLRSVPVADAAALLDAAIVEAPGIPELPLLRGGIILRMKQAGDLPGAIVQSRLRLAEVVEHRRKLENGRIVSYVQDLRDLLEQGGYLEDRGRLVAELLERVRTDLKKEEDQFSAPLLADLLEIRAADLDQAGEPEVAESLLAAECERLGRFRSEAPASRELIGRWTRLMRCRVGLSHLRETPDGDRIEDEIEQTLLSELQHHPDSQPDLDQFLFNRTERLEGLVRSRPAQARELLAETLQRLDASPVREEDGIRRRKQRLLAFEDDIDRAERQQAMIGKPAPAELFGAGNWIHGDPRPLSGLRGHVVLIDFWAVWCGPCLATFPQLRAFHEEFHDKGLEIVGVTRRFGYVWDGTRNRAVKGEGEPSLEAESAMLEAFAKHMDLPWPTFLPVDTEAMEKAFAVRNVPQLVLVDRNGTVRLVNVGASKGAMRVIREENRRLIAEPPESR